MIIIDFQTIKQLVTIVFLIVFFFLQIFRVYFGESHQKYADTLLDYGFFLLNVDDIVRSVHAYTVRCLFHVCFYSSPKRGRVCQTEIE